MKERSYKIAGGVLLVAAVVIAAGLGMFFYQDGACPSCDDTSDTSATVHGTGSFEIWNTWKSGGSVGIKTNILWEEGTWYGSGYRDVEKVTVYFDTGHGSGMWTTFHPSEDAWKWCDGWWCPYFGTYRAKYKIHGVRDAVDDRSPYGASGCTIKKMDVWIGGTSLETVHDTEYCSISY